MSGRYSKGNVVSGHLRLSTKRKKNRGSQNLEAWRKRQKLLAEMKAAGLVVDNLPGIVIKQEIIEAEEEESPSFILYPSSSAVRDLPSDGRPVNISGDSMAYPSPENWSTCMSRTGHHNSILQQSSNQHKSTQTLRTVTADKCSNVDFNRPRDHFDIFGELIATELRNMDANTSTIVQTVLLELVYEVQSGKHLTDELRTSLALKSMDLINRINSVDGNNQMISPDVDEKEKALSAEAMEESPSVVSDSPSATLEKYPKNVSVTLTTSYPQETTPESSISLGKEAISDRQGSKEKHSQSIDNITRTPAEVGCEKEFSELKSCSQLDSAIETTRISKVIEVDRYSDVSFDRARDQSDIFGEFIIFELKKMDAISNLIVQKLISELIFEAKLGILISNKKSNLPVKSCFLVNRFHSVDESHKDETNSSFNKTNQN